MKVALHNGVNGMEIVSKPMPKLQKDEVLVKVKATGMCGSDLLHYKKNSHFEEKPGGHEISGEIVDLGPGSPKELFGLNVAVDLICSGGACFKCWFCLKGQYNCCENSQKGYGGGFSEFLVSKYQGCYKLLEGMSFSDGALVEPLAVSIHAIRRSKMSIGDSVAVIGTGNIGLTSIIAAKSLGCGKIFATSKHKQQAELAKYLGAEIFDPSDENFKEMILEFTSGKGVDISIETVGGESPSTLEQAIEVTRNQGKVVVLGGFLSPITTDWIKPLVKEQEIIFSHCYSLIEEKHDFDLAIDLISKEKDLFSRFVTDEFPLDEINQAFSTAYDKTNGSIKVQILER